MGLPRCICPGLLAHMRAWTLGCVLSFLCGAAWGQTAITPLASPTGSAYDAAGDLYFAETGQHVIRRLTPAGVLSVVAGTGTQGFAGDGGPATLALLDSPQSVALDAAGDLFIADTDNGRVRRVDAASGAITTVVIAKRPAALVLDAAGRLIFADVGTHQVVRVDLSSGLQTVLAGSGVQGYAGDGTLATAAGLDSPYGLAFDAAGDLLIADTHNHRVRRVDAATGVITTVAGTGAGGFSGDGLATASELDLPRGLAVDAAGGMLVADAGNQRVRRVDAYSGAVTTIAGSGVQGFSGDGGPATSATLNEPRAVSVAGPGTPSAGLPTISDTRNQRVRQVLATGRIQTIAGQGAVVSAPGKAVTTCGLSARSPAMVRSQVSAMTGPVPSGTVSLLDGGDVVAAAGLEAGEADFSTGALSSGTHTLTAQYGGSVADAACVSAPLLVAIAPVGSATDFTLIAASGAITTPQGSPGVLGFTLTPVGGPMVSAVALAVTGLPVGATASFNPATLPPPSGATPFSLTVTVPALVSMRVLELPVIALCVLIAAPGLRRRRRMWMLTGVILLGGCGTRTVPEVSGNSGAAYNLVITATGTSAGGAVLTHSVGVVLTVD